MRRRMLSVLVIAICMGLITSVAIYRTLKAKSAPQAEQTEQIVAAAANIDLGEALTAQHVKLVAWPKDSMPPGPLKATKDAEGRVARIRIAAGEPILESKLAAPGQGGLMPVLVPSGKRAVSIKVDEAVQRSGFVVPNSRVDVLVTVSNQKNERETKIVLQDVNVLAADQTVEMKDNKPVTMTTVTMAVSPDEAERLALAQNEGRVTLALRSVGDTANVTTSGVTIAKLMGSPVPVPASASKQEKKLASATRPAHRPVPKAVVATVPQPSPVQAPAPIPTHTVSVIRGVNSTDLVFEQDSAKGWREASGKADGAKK